MKSIILKRTIKLLAFALICLGFFGISKVQAKAGEMTMHTIFVGHGDCILFESNGHYMLVDSGEKIAHETILDYLDKHIEGNVIDYCVATHADKDHISGFPYVLDKYEVKNMIYGEPMKPFVNPDTGDDTNYKKFVDAINAEEGMVHGNAYEGQKFTVGDTSVEVLYDGRQGSTFNESSVVMRVSCDDKSVLMTGDLPTTMETKLMKKGYNFKADILKVAHHGAGASTSEEFLDHVKPSYAVISNGWDGDTYFPKDSVLQRLALKFVKTYLADEGDIVMNIKDNVISTTHAENKKFECISKGQIVLSQTVMRASEIVNKRVCPEITVYANGELIPSSGYTVTTTGNNHTGIAKIQVTGNKKKYVGTLEATFSILPRSTRITSAVRSKNKKSITLKWNAQKYCTKYQIKYSTDKNIKKNVTTLNLKGGTNSKKTIKKLKKKKKYYFKVRAYTEYIGYGKWSKKVKR